MLGTLFATKQSMTQAWDKNGRRWAVTKLQVEPNLVIREFETQVRPSKAQSKRQNLKIFEIGYGKKKFKNMPKPLQGNLKRSGFSFGVKNITGVRVAEGDSVELKPGAQLKLAEILAIGDVVKVQGVSKGRGFAGAVKRYCFAGGPRTHGQSDRERAVGSIGSGTYPGRVWKGKRMPGHMGVETKTIENLVVLYLNPVTQELWLSGPVPGAKKSPLKIITTGKKKLVELNETASGIVKVSEPEKEINVSEEVKEIEVKKAEDQQEAKAEEKEKSK